MIDTPCIGICQLNKADVCVGCFRTRNEISLWMGMSDEQRQHIINNTTKEREQLYWGNDDSQSD